MRPAFSVVVFTTLIGAAQGLFLALFVAGRAGLDLAALQRPGAALAAALAAAGLAASFLHLGRPERAWRAAAMWRTSWLSREVIVLPLFIAGVVAWGAGPAATPAAADWLGWVTAALALALFVCTAMIYMAVRFLQAWAHPLTLVNYTLQGLASGLTLASALVAWLMPSAVSTFVPWALACTAAALLARGASLWRTARLVPRSTLQTALGIRHPKIAQQAMGFMGGSYNTREFFHGRSPGFMRRLPWLFMAAAFVLPMGLLATGSGPLLALAFLLQYVGLLGERWHFFAAAEHPQNLYYRTAS